MLEGNVDPNQLSRVQLLELAQSLRVSDADVMTRAELRAAIDKARRPEPKPAAEPVTWVSVARRLLASIVEQGLNLPDAAALIRGDTKLSTPPKAPPPVATVTLARIYAAQGHLERAIKTLDEVLTSDPDHDLARQLRQQLLTRLEERRAQAASAAPARASAESGPDTDAEAKDTDAPPVSSIVDVETEDAITAAAAAADAAKMAAAAADAAAAEADADAAADAVTAAAAAVVEAAVAAIAALSSPPPPDPSLDEDAAPDTHANPGLEASDSELPDARVTPAAPDRLGDAPSDPAPPSSGIDIARASGALVFATVAESAAPESAAPESAAVLSPAAAINGEARAARVANDAPPPPFASSPQLLVIETNTPTAYLYWELGTSPGAASTADPHWISVVVHSPHGAGTQRQQRSFPVSRATGALRLQGLPHAAVVRAKLTREGSATARPLAVASNVRSEEPPTRTRLDPSFNPGARSNARGLANHAIDHLARASAAYW